MSYTITDIPFFDDYTDEEMDRMYAWLDLSDASDKAQNIMRKMGTWVE